MRQGTIKFSPINFINSRFNNRLFICIIILAGLATLTPLATADTTMTPPAATETDVKVVFNDKATANLPAQKIVINIPSRTLTLYEAGITVNSWPVGLGRSNFKTPLGSYNILFKIKKPTWVNPYNPKMRIGPGPDNPLGTRWMEFKEDPTGDYGIHGTNSPLSVGKFSSHGCVRMRIPDAEALFEKVAVKTPVEITYNQVVSWEKNKNIYIRVYADYYNKGKPTLKGTLADLEKKYAGVKIDQTVLLKALSLANESIVQVGNIPVITSDKE